jgi:hypothetical protein
VFPCTNLRVLEPVATTIRRNLELEVDKFRLFAQANRVVPGRGI